MCAHRAVPSRYPRGNLVPGWKVVHFYHPRFGGGLPSLPTRLRVFSGRLRARALRCRALWVHARTKESRVHGRLCRRLLLPCRQHRQHGWCLPVRTIQWGRWKGKPIRLPAQPGRQVLTIKRSSRTHQLSCRCVLTPAACASGPLVTERVAPTIRDRLPPAHRRPTSMCSVRIGRASARRTPR